MKDPIRKTIEEFISAERAGDSETIAKQLHDEFIGIGPLGFLLTKDQWLGRHRDGSFSYSRLELEEVSVRLFDETAIVIARQDQVAGYKDQQVTAELRVSVVLIKSDGKWSIVHLQMSSIGQPPQFSVTPGGAKTE